MDVNQVRFGSYSIGNPQGGSPKKSEEKASETQTQNQQDLSQVKTNVDAFLMADNVAAMQGLYQVRKNNADSLDTWEAYVQNAIEVLGEKRASDIEAMMPEFESGVSQVAQTIEAEFPGMFAPDKLNALAAEVFAAE